MGLNFPNAPTEGQRFTAEGSTFVWRGALWIMEADSIPWASLAEALAGVSTDTIMSPQTMRAAIEADTYAVPDLGALTCVAWALINGTTSAIIASRNVATCTPVGSGSHKLTYQVALPSAEVIVHATAIDDSDVPMAAGINVNFDPTTTTVDITTGATGGSESTGQVGRGPLVHIAVFQ